MNLIGQDKIINFIKSNNISTIPRTIMLEGGYGSGKHSICKILADTYSLDIEDISDNLTFEKIEQIILTVAPKIYLIDSSSITVKNENAILKFLEEPLKNAIIVILCENKYSLLETIRNRCYILSLEKYSDDILVQFIPTTADKELYLKICDTPGEILTLQENSLKDMLNLCEKIFTSINRATYANTLSLSDKMAFKNEKDKFNFNLFFKLLTLLSYDRVIQNTPNCIFEYNLTNDYLNKLSIKNIDKKMLFENYLLKLKQSRG